MHSSTLHRLSTLRLPAHVQHDEIANRFRNVKYAVRMSRTGFNLLVGWLTEGIGGEGNGAGVGFSGDQGKRGRAAVMRVVNNHLRFDGKLSRCTPLHDRRTLVNWIMRSVLAFVASYYRQPEHRVGQFMGGIHWSSLFSHSSTRRLHIFLDTTDEPTSFQYLQG